jgi:glycosyltransferase involved in cell wall biosynthesis
MKVVLIAPPVEGARTGGNLYNRGLVRALRGRGIVVEVVGVEGVVDGDCVLVDSLYLEALPAIGNGNGAGLLAHYLPSLVACGEVPPAESLTEAERAAIAAASRFVAPSAFMASALTALGARGRIDVIEPAVEIGARRPVPPDGERLRAIVVANVVPGKGVLALVETLAPALRAGAPIELTIVGALDADRAYAEACIAAAAGLPSVRFAGELAHEATLDAIAASTLFLSPSRMESYGMALAEARALGVPIVARRGGHAAAHVDARAGGELVDDEAAVAAACIALAGDRDALRRRWDAAQAMRPPSRGWDDAAAEFVTAFERTSE